MNRKSIYIQPSPTNSKEITISIFENGTGDIEIYDTAYYVDEDKYVWCSLSKENVTKLKEFFNG